VNKNSSYIEVESGSEKYILNENLAASVFKDKEFKVLKKFNGDELLGEKYIPVYDY